MAGGGGARVLVTGDGYYATLAAVRGLRAGGYEPWLATTTDRSLAARSRAIAGGRRVPDPADGVERFVAALAALAAEIGAAAVLPGTEGSLAALAGRTLGDAVVAAPEPEALARATDKEALRELARAAGLRAPDGVPVALPGPPPEGATFPAVLKPARSTVHAGERTVDLPRARRVDDGRELAATLGELPPGDYLVQPFLEGPLGALAGVARDGVPVCAVQQVARRIEPPGAGASAFAESVEVDGDLLERAGAVLAGLGWTGLWELQFVATPDGPALIDFNPRFYGSLALAIASGANLPAIWVDLLLGRPPRVGRYRPGRRYRAEGREARLLAATLRERRLREAAAILTPRRRVAHAVFSWRDPGPALALAARALH